jgi:4-carboxymuconolactone decarboxylase
MNNKIALILAGIFVSLLSFTSVSQAQTISIPELGAKQQGIITIAAFTANGNLEKLKTSLNEGLDAGLTVNEIKEVLVQMYAYTGFPRSLNAINTFITVIEERESKGIHDELGREANPLPADKSSIELGTEIQTQLVGAPYKAKFIAFTPAMDQFLKGHLFGDIFGRDNLDFQSRELATISALSSMEGVTPQLQSHFNVGFNIGLTETQMKSLISVIEAKVGTKEAANATAALNKVISSRTR